MTRGLDRIKRPAAAGAVALVLATAWPAAADRPGEALSGLWHRDDFAAVDIAEDRLVRIAGDQRWEHSADTCADWFEHHAETTTGAALIETYDFPEFADPWGEPLGDALVARIEPDTEYRTLRSSCCCLGEIPSSEQFVLLTDETLLGIASGDGVFALETYRRSVPPPSHDGLSAADRREIQTLLRERGHYRAAIDGIFGPGTEAAIRAYQAEIGAEPTGILSASQIIRLRRGD